jgi:cytochrome c-type biogenesis protein CcmH/NrfG
MSTPTTEADVEVVAGLPGGGGRTRAIGVVAALALVVAIVLIVQSNRARDARMAAELNRARVTPTAKTVDSVPVPPPNAAPSTATPVASATTSATPPPSASTPAPAVTPSAMTTTTATIPPPTATSTAATASAETPPPVNGSLLKQAQRALEHNQVGNALALAQQATQQNPGSADAWWMLGACYDAAGQRGQAKAAYQRCATLPGPVSTECKALLGR